MSTATAAGTTIEVKDRAISKAITEFKLYNTEAKAAETKADLAKKKIHAFAEEHWLDRFSITGLLPPSPFKLVNKAGESVNFTIQDRTGGEIKAEVHDELRALLGPSEFGLVATGASISLDPKTLDEPALMDPSTTVRDVLVTYVNHLRHVLTVQGILSREQAERVFQVRQVKILKPGLLGKLPTLAARAKVSIADILALSAVL